MKNTSILSCGIKQSFKSFMSFGEFISIFNDLLQKDKRFIENEWKEDTLEVGNQQNVVEDIEKIKDMEESLITVVKRDFRMFHIQRGDEARII